MAWCYHDILFNQLTTQVENWKKTSRLVTDPLYTQATLEATNWQRGPRNGDRRCMEFHHHASFSTSCLLNIHHLHVVCKLFASPHLGHRHHCRVDSRLVSCQWEMSLQSNAISHWLGTNLESALHYGMLWDTMQCKWPCWSDMIQICMACQLSHLVEISRFRVFSCINVNML